MLLFSASLKKTKLYVFFPAFQDLGSYNGSNFLKCVWDLLRMSWRLFFRKMTLAMNSFFGNVEKRLNIQAHATWGLEKWSFLCQHKTTFCLPRKFPCPHFFLMISFLCLHQRNVTSLLFFNKINFYDFSSSLLDKK